MEEGLRGGGGRGGGDVGRQDAPPTHLLPSVRIW